jgi:tetratricopeptide (TPR) repeat protein
MANKYEIRRRARKDSQDRSENPYRSPRYGGRPEPVFDAPPPMDRLRTTLLLCLGLTILIACLYSQTAWHKFTVCDDNVYIYGDERPQVKGGLTQPVGQLINYYLFGKPKTFDEMRGNTIVWAFADAHEGNWHPLTWISHMLDWQLFGKWQPETERYVDSWPGGHHLVSMLIHCANTLLLFIALRLMTGTLWPSFVVAALFGVHPLRAESVAWAAERKDVLCGLFWMASLLAYTFYVRRRPIRPTSLLSAVGIAIVIGILFIRAVVRPDLSPSQSMLPVVLITFAVAGMAYYTSLNSVSWLTQLAEIGSYLLITFFFALGLMAKSMIVTLPCVFILLDIWPLGRWKKVFRPPGIKGPRIDVMAAAWLLLEKIPWFAMVYGDCYITVYGQNAGVALNSFEGLPLAPRLLNAVESCGEYLRQTFWPTGLAPFYTHPAMIPDGWTQDFYTRFFIYAALLTAITAAAIWFFRTRPYLAVGWFWYLGALMPVIGIIQVGTQARADRYTYLPMIGVYLMVAWLLKELVDRWPQTRIAVASVSVAVLLVLSAVTFRQVSYWIDSYKLFQHAVEVTEKNYFAFNHIGIAYDSDAKKDLAAAESAADAQVSKDLRKTAEQEFDLSADAFRSAIEIKPDYDFGNNNLGVYYARRGGPEDLKLAEKYFRGALMSNQRYADAYNNLGIVLARQGKFDDAIKCHLAGLNVRPDRASDHNNLCRAYMGRADQETKGHELEKAKDDLASAMQQGLFSLQCNMNFLGAYLSLAEIFIRQDKFEEASKCVLKMVTIDARSSETIQAQALFAENCLNRHRPDQAIDLLNQSLESNSAVPQVYRLRALVYIQKGDWAHAREDIQQLLKLAPNFPGGMELLRGIEANLNKPAK